MNLDKNEVFREATLRICGDLEIETAMVSFLQYIAEFIPVDRLFLQYFDQGLNVMRTIVDANLTTILAAGVLWQFGSGTVKGFATTLFWGILCSMVTAIFITRTIFMVMTERKTMTKLSI